MDALIDFILQSHKVGLVRIKSVLIWIKPKIPICKIIGHKISKGMKEFLPTEAEPLSGIFTRCTRCCAPIIVAYSSDGPRTYWHIQDVHEGDLP